MNKMGNVYQSEAIFSIHLDQIMIVEFILQFTVHQRLRLQPYVSEWYLIRRGDRQSCLEVDPPLLLREDVKIEFHVKPRVDIIKPKFMQSKKVKKVLVIAVDHLEMLGGQDF